jgi:hypothetical protein
MLIGENYSVVSDELEYIVQEKYVPQSGKRQGEIIWMSRAYFKELREVINWIVEKEIKGTGFEDLVTVNQKIEELKRDLFKVVK